MLLCLKCKLFNSNFLFNEPILPIISEQPKRKWLSFKLVLEDLKLSSSYLHMRKIQADEQIVVLDETRE